MVEDSGEGNLLSFAAAEDVDPRFPGLEAAGLDFSLVEMFEVDHLHNFEEFVITNLGLLVGVDNLVAEGACGQVGLLRKEENLFSGGDGHLSSGERPQLGQDAVERTLSAAVGPDKQTVLALLDLTVRSRRIPRSGGGL